MSRPLALAAVLALPAASGTAAPVPKDRPPAFFPTTAGAKWVYHKEAGGRGWDFTLAVTAADRANDGTVRLTVGLDEGGGDQPFEVLEVSRKGVFRLSARGADLDPPLQVLRPSVAAGEAWETETKMNGTVFKGTWAVRGRAKVSVPAGDYDAVVVEGGYRTGTWSEDEKFWYAEGVGMVRRETRTKDKLSVTELKAFTPAP